MSKPHILKLATTEGLSIPWDHEVLAATNSKILVELDKGSGLKEYVVWDYDDEGNCYNGTYTPDKQYAIGRFKETAFLYL